MIYHFTYKLNSDYKTKVCMSLREAELFFDILLSAGCDYVRVVTTPRRKHYD